ncbi:MAG: hypothetical protein ISR96_10815 [Nitrospira sp.]|nr:hypothetical protein [Nitrospira sp.]
MSIFDYFKPVSTMKPDEVRQFLKDHDQGQFNLIDVRQPMEYKMEHIPGATLIPLGQLSEQLDKLDPAKPTIIY